MRRSDWMPWLDAMIGAAVAVFLCVAFSEVHADPHDTAVLLQFSDGGECSGTVVGAHTILTATHCIDGNTGNLKVNGAQVHRVSIMSDGADHALLTVDMEYPAVAKVNPDGLRQGDRIRYWGNPMYFHDVYREGYVAGTCEAPKECFSHIKVAGATFKGPMWELVVPGGPGDSGAGVFNEQGEVVGVVSAIVPITVTLEPMMACPFRFPAHVWSELK